MGQSTGRAGLDFGAEGGVDGAKKKVILPGLEPLLEPLTGQRPSACAIVAYLLAMDRGCPNARFSSARPLL